MQKEELSVTRLSGIDKKTAEEWAKKGYGTLEKIANASSQELVKNLGLNIAKAQKYIAEAQQILAEESVVIETAKKILDFRRSVIQRISTGSKRLDEILGGGVQTDALTLFGGSYGTGKTQLCHQLCVNCVLDLNRKAVYIETEPSTFHPERLTEMAVIGRNASIDLEKDIYGIRARYVQSPKKLYKAYEMIEDDLIKAGVNVGIICIDSFSAVFRKYYQGRGRLSDRGEEQTRHISMLQRLSSKYNIAIVYTGQVYGIPDEKEQSVARRRMGIPKKIYGGEYFLHSATYQVSLEQDKGGQSTEDIWEAYVFDAPNLARRTARFVITKAGIRDLP